MIKFVVFNLFDTEKNTVECIGFLGKKYNYTYDKRKYANTYELYQAVADFLESIGDKFVCMSGMSKLECSDYFIYGDIVVWYKT